MTLFVDTSMFYAAADDGDVNTSGAREVLSAGHPLLTTDHVLVESWVLMSRRLGRSAAERFWDGLRSGIATIEPVGVADLEVAFAIGRDYPDQDFSIVDRTSFAVMHRLGLERVATYDSHFAVYRFGRNRARAFTIVHQRNER